MQDGIDLLTALARHPETARRLARKLWNFFISEQEAPARRVRRRRGRRVPAELTPRCGRSSSTCSPRRGFTTARSVYARYAWPVEFVARAIKETGLAGFSIDNARTPLANMGQMLFEPPDVNGWELGAGWFSTGSMLSRMNFASTLAANQRFNLARAVPSTSRAAPDLLISAMLERFSPMSLRCRPAGRAGGLRCVGWCVDRKRRAIEHQGTQPGAPHLGSAEYQFM